MKDPAEVLTNLENLQRIKPYARPTVGPVSSDSNVERLCGLILVIAGLIVDVAIEEKQAEIAAGRST